MTRPITVDAELESIQILLMGQVQGLGVRPAIYRTAKRLGVKGSVRNTSAGVVIDAEGTEDLLASFRSRLVSELPIAAEVQRIEVQPKPVTGVSTFRISKEKNRSSTSSPVPVDRCVCDDCLKEVFDSTNRRYRYPWISCTNCGPRFSIIKEMPYEREQTAYERFEMCEACTAEFNDPSDRRFHAQTISCPDCGPQIWSWTPGKYQLLQNQEAIQEAAGFIRIGQIVAVRGIGGYQLLVDATNDQAVRRLRERKGRKSKPLALIVDSLDMAERLCIVDPVSSCSFVSPANPIQLLEALPNNGIAKSVHPGLNTLGILLPSSGLHALLLAEVGRPLVCTSGNLEGEPLEYEVENAQERLTDVCDFMLHHDLTIVHPIDDSVVRMIGGRNVTLRAARGLAPLTINVPIPTPAIALGAFQKTALAWSTGVSVTLGPHIGDHQTEQSRQRYDAARPAMERLYQLTPEIIVHDAHPGYYSTQVAKQSDRPTVSVQHHHAHIVSTMVELGWLNEEVIGIAWDGTGFGNVELLLDERQDVETIWGGEFLSCHVDQFTRIGSLRPFRLPGGEMAIKEPWRVAVSVVEQCRSLVTDQCIDSFYEKLAANPKIGPSRLAGVRSLTESESFAPLTTSAGRLFDALASILLEVHFSDFEGYPAMMLEEAAWQHCRHTSKTSKLHNLDVSQFWQDSKRQLDWRPIIANALVRMVNGDSVAKLAYEFHWSLATGVTQFCDQFHQRKVVLGGGVFQNRLLTEILEAQLGSERLGRAARIPPNDGGIAIGQLIAATFPSSLTVHNSGE